MVNLQLLDVCVVNPQAEVVEYDVNLFHYEVLELLPVLKQLILQNHTLSGTTLLCAQTLLFLSVHIAALCCSRGVHV